MRSSTSNSERSHTWRKCWLLCAGIVVAVLLVWEFSLRQSGLTPDFADNRSLWLSARQQLARPDDSAIAILGASRAQRAIDVDELSAALQRPVVQLSVEGTSGLPVLENLAVDPRFSGTVVISIAPAFSFNRKLSKLDEGNQAAWVKSYVSQSRSRRMEQELRLDVQERLTFRAPDAAMPRIATALLRDGKFPGPDYKQTRRNRFVSIDQSKFEREVNQEAIVSLYMKNSEPYEEKGFAEIVQYFAAVVDLLNKKGCRVFVVRLPSEGKVLEFERQHFPQEKFWNIMKQKINAKFIHFEEYPQLGGFLSVDGSHIDAASANAFTKQFAQVLRQNQI